MNPKFVFSKELSRSTKHMKILEGLLKLPENKECADCKSKAPRWASTNLGIFICLQCSGIHRSLGVHISKVRSTTLDTWLPEQVAFMQSMGNKKSNVYWEGELPLHYDRSQIEYFIRAKYIEKRWIPRDCVVKSESPSISKQGLSSSHSSRRFGRIAEWNNNQHLCKESRDCSSGEEEKVRPSPNSDKVHEDSAGNENEPQRQEKKENSQPSTDRNAYDVKSVKAEPCKELAQVVPELNANGSLRKSDQQVLKIKSSSVKAIVAFPSSKIDYATELFRTLCIEDSSNPSDMSGWVQFDSEQESSIQEANIVPKPAVKVGLIHEEKLTSKSSTSKIHPGPEIEYVQTATLPFATGHFSKHQKDAANESQSFSKMADTVSASSIDLQRLAMLAQGVSSTDAPNSPGSVHCQCINSFQQHKLKVNGVTVERTTRTQMPVQNYHPAKLAVDSVPDTMSSLYRPAIPFKSKSTNQARGHPAALPVSGYDYDFSFLTQGMFTKL